MSTHTTLQVHNSGSFNMKYLDILDITTGPLWASLSRHFVISIQPILHFINNITSTPVDRVSKNTLSYNIVNTSRTRRLIYNMTYTSIKQIYLVLDIT